MRINTVLKNCEFYDTIVNFGFNNTDYISLLLINDYKKYVLSRGNKTKNKIKQYDLIMNEYVTNKKFYKYVQDEYNNCANFVLDGRIYILNEYNKFLNNKVRTDLVSRWI